MIINIVIVYKYILLHEWEGNMGKYSASSRDVSNGPTGGRDNT